MKDENSIAALLEACHRALDDLRRLDTTKPIVEDHAARDQCFLSRWRSAEPGTPRGHALTTPPQQKGRKPMNEQTTKWELIDRREGTSTSRLVVPGGWLYLVRELHGSSSPKETELRASLAVCFVPHAKERVAELIALPQSKMSLELRTAARSRWPAPHSRLRSSRSPPAAS